MIFSQKPPHTFPDHALAIRLAARHPAVPSRPSRATLLALTAWRSTN